MCQILSTSSRDTKPLFFVSVKTLYFKALCLCGKKGARQNKNGIQFEREARREVSHGNGSDHKGQRLMGRRVSHTPVSVSRAFPFFSLSLMQPAPARTSFMEIRLLKPSGAQWMNSTETLQRTGVICANESKTRTRL